MEKNLIRSSKKCERIVDDRTAKPPIVEAHCVFFFSFSVETAKRWRVACEGCKQKRRQQRVRRRRGVKTYRKRINRMKMIPSEIERARRITFTRKQWILKSSIDHSVSSGKRGSKWPIRNEHFRRIQKQAAEGAAQKFTLKTNEDKFFIFFLVYFRFISWENEE